MAFENDPIHSNPSQEFANKPTPFGIPDIAQGGSLAIPEQSERGISTFRDTSFAVDSQGTVIPATDLPTVEVQPNHEADQADPQNSDAPTMLDKMKHLLMTSPVNEAQLSTALTMRNAAQTPQDAQVNMVVRYRDSNGDEASVDLRKVGLDQRHELKMHLGGVLGLSTTELSQVIRTGEAHGLLEQHKDRIEKALAEGFLEAESGIVERLQSMGIDPANVQGIEFTKIKGRVSPRERRGLERVDHSWSSGALQDAADDRNFQHRLAQERLLEQYYGSSSYESPEPGPESDIPQTLIGRIIVETRNGGKGQKKLPSGTGRILEQGPVKGLPSHRRGELGPGR